MPCPPSIDARCEKIVTNVSWWCPDCVICPVILAKYCHVTGDDRELWLTLPRLLRASRDPPPQPSPLPRLSPSLITSHHSPMLQMWKHEAFVPSLESKFMLTRLKHCNGTHVILTHSKLTHDWHEYLFSYKRCKSFPQLNCDADKSCHNKQYLWLRRLWAIVAVRAVTKNIKLLNEWVDSIISLRAIYRNKGFVSSLMESPFAN